MNKSERHNVDNYLSIKRITIISLAITIGFYVLFILKRYFSRPLMPVVENVEYRTPYWIILLVNIVFSFVMAFLLFLYERKALGYPFKMKRDELMANIIMVNTPCLWGARDNRQAHVYSPLIHKESSFRHTLSLFQKQL